MSMLLSTSYAQNAAVHNGNNDYKKSNISHIPLTQQHQFTQKAQVLKIHWFYKCNTGCSRCQSTL